MHQRHSGPSDVPIRDDDDVAPLPLAEYMALVVAECQTRGLQATAAFLCDLLLHGSDAVLQAPVACIPDQRARLEAAFAPVLVSSGHRSSSLLALQQAAAHNAALSYFSAGEYRRAHHTLTRGLPGAVAAAASSSRSAFLAAYSLYMDGEKTRQGMGAGGAGSSTAVASAATAPVNPSLHDALHLTQGSLHLFPGDGYLLWLSGVVQREMGRQQAAVSAWVDAVLVNPLLRCAWEDLERAVTRVQQLRDVRDTLQNTPCPFMLRCFEAEALKSLHLHADAQAAWESLLDPAFPDCPFMVEGLASALSAARAHSEAVALYSALHERHPFRLDGVDDFSNSLFMTGERQALATLAQAVYATDPFSAKANVAVGNYYAIQGKHDRSLFYFRRAVHIDPALLSAWILLGHEYLEVKNASAAAEAYRAAILIDRRDARVWYALGQVYELHHLYTFALNYYAHTVQLCPTDPRMWRAAATCLEKLNRIRDMVRCLEVAERHEPPSSEAYATIVRTIASRILMWGSPRAMDFMAKLLESPFRLLEDEIVFLPLLLRFHLSKAGEGLPRATREGEAQSRLPPEHRVADLQEHAATASHYLERLRDLIASRRGAAADATRVSAVAEAKLREAEERFGGYEDTLASIQDILSTF